jgi:4-amino-4-deoxy-L-arabinose transferase-like glycosyltransferase
MALHPQFLLVSIAANPDALVNFCGAFAWWQTARLIAKPHAAVSVVLMFVAAAAAIAVKRLGFPLLLGVACASAFWLWQRRSPRTLLVALGAAVLSLLAIGVAAATFPTEVGRILATAAFVDERWKLDLSWEWISGFSRSLYESTWLVAGWMRYPVDGLWIFAWTLVLAVAVAGLIAAWKTFGAAERIGLLAAAALVLVHLLAIYLVHFPLHSGAQGRYLFPALGPMLALVWVGWRACATRPGAVRWPMLLVLFAFAFDVAAWASVLVPVYAR